MGARWQAAARVGLAVLALASVTCAGKLFQITIRDTSSVTVPRGTLFEQLVGSFGFGEFVAMDLTSYDEIQNQGVEPGDISEVYLTEFSLRATAGGDLSFLEQVDLWVEGPDLPRQLVATADDFAGRDEVVFELLGVDLTDYVVSESLSLVTDVRGRRPDADTTVDADFAIEVGVTGKGACNQL